MSAPRESLLRQLPELRKLLERPMRPSTPLRHLVRRPQASQTSLQARSFSLRPSPLSPRTITQKLRTRPFRRFESTSTPPSTTSESSPSLSARLRKLSREYGWSALGVYFLLSALDFPFCFLAVRGLGTEVVGRWEHWVLHNVKQLIKWPLGETAKEKVDGAGQEVKSQVLPLEEVRGRGEEKRVLEEDEAVIWDHGVEEAEKANQGDNASE